MKEENTWQFEPVYDIAGNGLRGGAEYNVLPADPSSGRSFVLGLFSNETCRLRFFRHKQTLRTLAFYAVNLKKGDIIRLCRDLHVYFPKTTTSCPEENFWELDNYDNCPTVCSYCEVMCKDLGIFVQDGKRRVALSDVPFEFSFQKAE